MACLNEYEFFVLLCLQACLVGHVPPGSTEQIYGGAHGESLSFTEKYNRRYIDLVVKYSHIIAGQFFGHLHRDTFRVIYDNDGKFIYPYCTKFFVVLLNLK